jgi:glycosyltransferase involved in cell wall biosynthesis
MKLIIQIPCYNEETTLPATLAELPRTLDNIDCIEYLVIDDGSTDGTRDVARQHGAHHVVRFTNNKGLAAAFKAGLDAALALGADIIVNTDADNQYRAAGIADLVGPILRGEADMVIGVRPIEQIEEFSALKKKLQRLGSWVVRRVSRTDIPDVTSGFRAYSRQAALALNIVSEFTYTLETVIQAGQQNLAITHVPIRTNPKTRPSRLFKSIGSYVRRSLGTIFRIYTMYRPLRVFSLIGGVLLAVGLILAVRYLIYVALGEGKGHVQSVIISGMLLNLGFVVMMIGILADLSNANRRLIEEVLLRVRRLELGARREPSTHADRSSAAAPADTDTSASDRPA